MKYNAELYLGNEIYGCDEDFVRKSEKIVKCRKAHDCNSCGKEIRKGDYAVCETGFMFGEPTSTYTCIECMEEWIEEIGRVENVEENRLSQRI